MHFFLVRGITFLTQSSKIFKLSILNLKFINIQIFPVALTDVTFFSSGLLGDGEGSQLKGLGVGLMSP